MSNKRRHKSISAAARRLLAQGESARADFKRAPEGVSADDLVSFANTDIGGAILVGIEEKTGPNGEQLGAVRGCDIGDATVLQITNKALSCLPPVAIDVHIENLASTPFLRVEIPPSQTKPHCTPKGVYCRREGSRNRPLQPTELLQIFLDSESRAFAERFETAAHRIKQDLSDLEDSLARSIKSMGDQLGWAEFKLDDTESTLDSILSYTQSAKREADDISTRLRALFRQDKRDDPIREKARKQLLDEVVEQLSNDHGLFDSIVQGSSVEMSSSGKAAVELDKKDFSDVLHEAVKIVAERIEAQRYEIQVKKPTDFTHEELGEFATLVTKAGEVAGGVKKRLASAALLGVILYDDKIVGTAALKKPIRTYCNRIFKSACSTESPEIFTRELGWVYIEPEHRSKGHIKPLLEKLMDGSNNKNIFATTKITNEKVQRILLNNRFVQNGVPYPSKQEKSAELALYIKKNAA